MVADRGPDPGPQCEQEIAVQEGDDVISLPFGEHGPIQAHALPRLVEMLGA